jgi:hypothetical protein
VVGCGKSTKARYTGSRKTTSQSALAHLEIGRAYATLAEAAKARAAYQDFLTLSKDADSNIPVLYHCESGVREAEIAIRIPKEGWQSRLTVGFKVRGVT